MLVIGPRQYAKMGTRPADNRGTQREAVRIMEETAHASRETARTATREEIPALLHHADPNIVLGLLDNPSFDETHLCLLLGHKELSTALLEEIANRKQWMSSYRVRLSLASHPRVPIATGLRLARELFVVDLVQLALVPSTAPPVKHLAEELILVRLPQLPSAQKMVLARRGTGRIIGALLADGQPEILSVILDSPFLNEGHVLRVLAKIAVPARVVIAIAESGRWSQHYSVRLALLRNPQTPIARAIAFLPSISTADLRILCESASVPTALRPHIRRELAHHMQRGTNPRKGNPDPRS